jgi:hypothetical protein
MTDNEKQDGVSNTRDAQNAASSEGAREDIGRAEHAPTPERMLATMGAPADGAWNTLANIADYLRVRGFTKGSVDDRVGALAAAYDEALAVLREARRLVCRYEAEHQETSPMTVRIDDLLAALRSQS